MAICLWLQPTLCARYVYHGSAAAEAAYEEFWRYLNESFTSGVARLERARMQRFFPHRVRLDPPPPTATVKRALTRYC